MKIEGSKINNIKKEQTDTEKKIEESSFTPNWINNEFAYYNIINKLKVLWITFAYIMILCIYTHSKYNDF